MNNQDPYNNTYQSGNEPYQDNLLGTFSTQNPNVIDPMKNTQNSYNPEMSGTFNSNKIKDDNIPNRNYMPNQNNIYDNKRIPNQNNYQYVPNNYNNEIVLNENSENLNKINQKKSSNNKGNIMSNIPIYKDDNLDNKNNPKNPNLNKSKNKFKKPKSSNKKPHNNNIRNYSPNEENDEYDKINSERKPNKQNYGINDNLNNKNIPNKKTKGKTSQHLSLNKNKKIPLSKGKNKNPNNKNKIKMQKINIPNKENPQNDYY